jgi:hypothetical protein
MIIGVYKDIHPFNYLSQERITAYLTEAHAQNVELVFFGIDHVYLDDKYLIGDVFGREGWLKKEMEFPKIMINDFGEKLNYSTNVKHEKKLKESIFQTVHPIQNKIVLNRRLLTTKCANYILPTKLVNDEQNVYAMLDLYKKVIIKPTEGNSTYEDLVITKGIKGYKVQDYKKMYILDNDKFKAFLSFLVIQNRYLVQPFIEGRLANEHPVDFIVHVIKNEKGRWMPFSTKARIRPNIDYTLVGSTMKKTLEATNFLYQHYSRQQSEKIIEKLNEVAMQLAIEIESLYPYYLDELTIDLVMNQYDEIQFCEANTCPKITENIALEERDRAYHMLGYTKHLLNQLLPSHGEYI